MPGYKYSGKPMKKKDDKKRRSQSKSRPKNSSLRKRSDQTRSNPVWKKIEYY